MGQENSVQPGCLAWVGKPCSPFAMPGVAGAVCLPLPCGTRLVVRRPVFEGWRILWGLKIQGQY